MRAINIVTSAAEVKGVFMLKQNHLNDQLNFLTEGNVTEGNLQINSIKLNSLKLSDIDLNQKIKNLVAQERKLTKEILFHIVEVDKRKLYLNMAYPSLYDYLTKEVGYSAAAAQRRIDAARLMVNVPEIAYKIETGKINLSQISKIQKVCRQIKKESGRAFTNQMKKSVIEKLENKNGEQTDLIIAQEFGQQVKVDTKVSIQKDESKRIEMTFTKEEMDLIEKAQSVLSNKVGGGLKDTILEMAKRITQSKLHDSKLSKEVCTKKESLKSTSAAEVKSLGLKLKKEILQKDQFCQFKDTKTGRVCGSKYYLEVDHILPRYLGGKNNKDNLRVLCKNHNQFRYQKDLFD